MLIDSPRRVYLGINALPSDTVHHNGLSGGTGAEESRGGHGGSGDKERNGADKRTRRSVERPEVAIRHSSSSYGRGRTIEGWIGLCRSFWRTTETRDKSLSGCARRSSSGRIHINLYQAAHQYLILIPRIAARSLGSVATSGRVTFLDMEDP